MLELLEQVFRQVRAYVHSEHFDRNAIHKKTRDHVTMRFDYDAEEIIIQGLKASGTSLEVITEERPTLTIGKAPAYRVIVDPIDGSNNVIRGIMNASVALAVLPIDAPITPENVQWALVGELFSGTVYEAQRGGGAFCNRKRCQVSDVQHFHECLVGINFDGRRPDTVRALLTEEPRPDKVRRSGTSALDSVYVANGAYDTYIDIGEVLTGESFLASASIVLESGGVVTDAQGKPLRPITSLTDTYSLVITGNKELHQEIISRIQAVSVK